MTALLARLIALLDTAVDTVINSAVDVLFEHWVEAEPPALCGNPTNGQEP